MGENRTTVPVFLCWWLAINIFAVASRPTDLPTANIPACVAPSQLPQVVPNIASNSFRADGVSRISFDIEEAVHRTVAVERKLGNGPWDAIAMISPALRGRRFFDEPAGSPVALYRLADRAASALMIQDFGCEPDSAAGTVPSPPVGDPWVVRGIGWGTYSMARITNGMAVDTNPNRQISYFGQRLRRMPQRIEMVGEWRAYDPAGTRDSFFTIALCAPSDTQPWYRRCVHIRLHKASVAIDTAEDGPLVFNRDVAPIDLPVGRLHHFVIEAEADLITIWVNGRRLIKSARPEYGASAGRYVFWEIYSEVAPIRNSVAIRSVGAFAPDAP